MGRISHYRLLLWLNGRQPAYIGIALAFASLIALMVMLAP